MTTRRNKIKKNKTRKIRSSKPSLKGLKIGYPLYASKKHEGDKLLEYKMNAEKKNKRPLFIRQF